jgi:hypothetical protein
MEYRPRLTSGEYDLIKTLRSSNVVGIIGDRHAPFTHPDYFEFIYETFNKFQVTQIVDIGDDTDFHNISYHESDPDGYNAGEELDIARKEHQKWWKAFPDVKGCIGNHSALPFRKLQTAGLPKFMMRSYNELLGYPDGWDWQYNHNIDDVIYTHGTGSSGQMGAMNRAKDNRQSTVIGHIHSFGGVMYSASDRDMIFGLNVGCGVDVRAYAMAYGKVYSKKPTLGCGIVIDGKYAFYIPMDLGRKIEYL